MEHHTAATLFKVGIGFLESEKYKLAIAYFDKTIQMEPRHSGAYGHRGMAWFRLLHIENAIEDLGKAIALDGQNHNAWFNRGVIFSEQHRYEEALRDFEGAHLAYPEHIIYLAYLASAQLNLKQYTAAIATCNALLRLAPDDVNGLSFRAFAHSMLQEYRQALADEKKLVRLFPDDATHCNNAGYSCSKLGQWQEALDYLESALFIDPRYAYALNNRGYVKYRLGKHTAALRDINASLEVDPSNSYAYKTGRWSTLRPTNGKRRCQTCARPGNWASGSSTAPRWTTCSGWSSANRRGSKRSDSKRYPGIATCANG
jgi:superkiller protein 3